MVAVALDLTTYKYDLVKDSGRRYEILNVARSDVLFEISKLVYNTEYFQQVPEVYQSVFRKHLNTLLDAASTRFGALCHDLGQIEQSHRQTVDAMYSCATNALSDELEEARSTTRPCSPSKVLRVD